MRLYCFLYTLLASSQLLSQSNERLDTVIVSAYKSNANWKNTAASVVLITNKQIERQPNGSLVGVLNTVAGVRMEERSPGSYRLSIRGSLLRSPFGVRNVKLYYKQMPLTDATGNSYLNLLHPGQFNKIEIIKGPPANMYGASTGGAVILDTDSDLQSNKAAVAVSTGSYGFLNQQLKYGHECRAFQFQFNQSHQQSDGYREHTKFRRDVLQFTGTYKRAKHQFNLFTFYSNLFYQTPGALNAQQYILNPRMARQPAGVLPGAVQQQAAIYNQTFFSGADYLWKLNERENIVIASGLSFTRFKNPFITNYELRGEQNYFHRSVYTKNMGYKSVSFRWISGVELLFNQSHINNYGNRAGKKDTLQAADKILIQQNFAFTQMNIQFKNKWVITAGASANTQSFKYKRLSNPLELNYTHKKLSPIISPRFSLLYTISADISLTGILSHGFSPPTLAEIRSSNTIFNTALAAEYGWNKEIILKGYILKRQLMFDIAWYQFNLQSAIVRRNNIAGQEYFINAGGTQQHGVEFLMRSFFKPVNRWQINGFISAALQQYKFKDYKQINNDFTSNQLTGVPAELLSLGVDVNFNENYFLNFTGNYSAAIPLTDANDEWAGDYKLLQVKAGYRWKKSNMAYEWFIFADNLLNENYSLGNDINAAGRRFYNAAMPLNLVTGFSFKWK